MSTGPSPQLPQGSPDPEKGQGLPWTLIQTLTQRKLPHVEWRPGASHLELTFLLDASERTSTGARGRPAPLLAGMTLQPRPQADGEAATDLIWQATLPRWAMWPHWQSSAASFTMHPGCGGNGLSLMVMGLGLRAMQDPLLPFADRESIAAIRDGLNLGEPWTGETPQAPVGPAVVQLTGLSGERVALITPCGEALRRSLRELGDIEAEPGCRLSTATPAPGQWTWPAPRPVWNISFDQARGIEALPWRAHGADDAALRAHGWRRAYPGEWDDQGRSPGSAPITAAVLEKRSARGKMERVLELSTPGKTGTLRAALRWRQQ